MTNNDNTFETSDLGLAASLYASKFIVTKVDKTNSRRVIFCFNKSKPLLDTVNAYWSNDLLLPAGQLMDSIKMLKTRIYGD